MFFVFQFGWVSFGRCGHGVKVVVGEIVFMRCHFMYEELCFVRVCR